MSEPKRVYSFRLSDELVEEVRIYAQKDNRSLSNQLEVLLEQFAESQRKIHSIPPTIIGEAKEIE